MLGKPVDLAVETTPGAVNTGDGSCRSAAGSSRYAGQGMSGSNGIDESSGRGGTRGRDAAFVGGNIGAGEQREIRHKTSGDIAKDGSSAVGRGSGTTFLRRYRHHVAFRRLVGWLCTIDKNAADVVQLGLIELRCSKGHPRVVFPTNRFGNRALAGARTTPRNLKPGPPPRPHTSNINLQLNEFTSIRTTTLPPSVPTISTRSFVLSLSIALVTK